MSIPARAKELERGSRQDASSLDPKELLVLMESEDWVAQMYVCRMLGRVDWPPVDYPDVRDFAFKHASGENVFVRAWALDALASLAHQDASIRPKVLRMLESALGAEMPSVRVRAKEGLKRLLGHLP